MARGPKYKRKIYKHQEWPKMVYHPTSGNYVVCASEAEVPDGFVDNINDCENKPTGVDEPVKCVNTAVPTKNKKPAAKKDEGESVPTLESLDLNRTEAMGMLDDEKIEYKKNISNDDLAALVSDLLEEE